MSIQQELQAFADHLDSRKEAVLHAWESAVLKDPQLCAGASLSQVEFFDHVPALLDTFQGELREYRLLEKSGKFLQFHESASSHGLKRWQQGYGLAELVRELGRLNECLVTEIDDYTLIAPAPSHQAISAVRQIWAQFSTVGIEQSVWQYALLQRQEAAGQMRDLESALDQLRVLEGQRAELWQQAAHDLRGNLGVVANASVGLTHKSLPDVAKDNFVRILIRNVTSLHQLLDDVTQLARLQAGQESRRVDQMDVTPLMHELCEGIRPVAQQKKLYLHCEGPPGLGVQGDSVKVRRIAQNLILNAVKFTQTGGITVAWSEGTDDENKHWVLTIADTGPGFPSASGLPMAAALKNNGSPIEATETPSVPDPSVSSKASTQPLKVIDSGPGEGLGLSIVKRLCEILDATLQRHSIPEQGTTFTVLFPKQYLS